MASDGKIYITISDKRGEGGDNTPKPSEPKKPQKEENVVGKYALHSAFNFLEQQANQFVNYSIANIGNFTGDYQNQRNVQQAFNMFNLSKGLIMSTSAGFQVGGPVGALVGLTLAVGTQAINIAYSEYSNNFANKKINHNIDKLREISGIDVLTNGSR